MGQFEELWCYCRETLRIVLDRPFLFVPRLIFSGVLLIVIFAGVGSFFFGAPMTMGMLGLSGAVIALVIVSIIGSLLLAAGELNLFKKAAFGYVIGAGDFWEGVKRFTGKVVIGHILMILVIIAVSIPALVLIPFGGLRVIGAIAIVVLSFAAAVLLSMWRAAVAFKGIGVVEAFKDSYNFVKAYFWPVALVVFIRGIFDGNRNNNNNRGGNSGFNINFNFPGIQFDINKWRSFGWDIAALIPIAIIFTLISILIVIYLDQLTFVIYSRREGIVAEC